MIFEELLQGVENLRQEFTDRSDSYQTPDYSGGREKAFAASRAWNDAAYELFCLLREDRKETPNE